MSLLKRTHAESADAGGASRTHCDATGRKFNIVVGQVDIMMFNISTTH